MEIIDGLEMICPKCNGKGMYEYFNNEEANQLYDRYMDVEMKDANTAWVLAKNQSTKLYDCKQCMKRGKVLTDKGKEILSHLEDYS
ncbi:hypothetical protein BKP45_06020 [Anaerobacillus alkalidiazotrophicus]|uniref:Uncharacterized protein n=1 Tax=Anaerobacillus alkalidiazotrophicus TaxID=472963 RepID=A0A1S2MBR7_9BACI|nr:hypothetical protein [Anaerobacillus alkalidiazotrophicus]OIJ22222.1 hypothetical protein BKP45_06020 [Anaerobacillus alkalidiazotrophicus]